MGFLGRIISWLHERFDRKTLGLLVTLVIALTLPLTVFLAQQAQQLRQRAAQSGGVQIVDASGNPISTTSDPNVYLKITLPYDWTYNPQAKNNLVEKVWAQTPCGQVRTVNTCGITTYDTCVDNLGQSGTSFCGNGATAFRCFASENSNCVSDPSGGYNYSCATCPVSVSPPTSTPRPTESCRTDCSLCSTRMTCGTITYDTCIDNFGRSSDNPSFCTGGATAFRCFAGENPNCASADQLIYNYSCSACPAGSLPSSTPTPAVSTPTAIPTEGIPQVSSPTPQIPTPTPQAAIHTLQGLYIENKDSDGSSGGREPLRITSNFADYLNKPIPWKLNELKADQNEATRIVQMLLLDGQINLPFTASIVLTKLVATASPTPAAQTSCIPLTGIPISVPVLVLEYYPPDPKSPNLLDGNETGWKQDAQINGRTIKFWEEKTQQMINQGIALINEATKYHGYKDSSAPQFLSYQVIDDKKFYQSIPRGHILEKKPDGDAVRPDYGGILRDLNICDYVDNKGVKEVWMYGYHNNNGIVPDESRMSSKYGDISNSQPKEQYIEEQYRMPVCKNSYVLYNFTYRPTGDPGNNLHNRLHQLENIIPYAEGIWPPTVQNTQRTIFWGDFAEYLQEDSPFVQQGQRVSSYRSSCGNTHITPNWNNSKTQGGRYDLQQQGEFNCETWHPDESKTTYIKAGCERWGCTELGFFKWFLQNIPGYNNGIIYQGKQMRNWWEAMYDFNAFIEQGRSLYGNSIFCSGKVKLQRLPDQSLIPDTSQAGTDQTRLVGDINNDGIVDKKDLDILINQFGKRGANLSADLDKNGVVDIFDYKTFVENFGKSVGP